MSRDRHYEDRQVHLSVYHRDRWTCQMPQCLCPDGRSIDRALRGTVGPWAPSIDHIQEVARGGRDETWNMRAAHRECNADDARAIGRNLTYEENVPVPVVTRIGDLFPGLADLMESLEP
jgi:hypothetical protein